MSIGYPDSLCYRHLRALRETDMSQEDRDHFLLCNGVRGPNSSFPCLNFVSIADIQRGICAYELRSKNSFGESLVKSQGHNCKGCNSNHNSARDSQDTTGCTGYTPMLAVINGNCAWHIRSQRLVDLYKGDRTKLKPEERHCLEECDAKKDVPCKGYIDIKYIVEQTCAHKVNLNIKLKNGREVEGLEEICANCTGQCESKKCGDSYISITDIHHFDVFNELHPLVANAA